MIKYISLYTFSRKNMFLHLYNKLPHIEKTIRKFKNARKSSELKIKNFIPNGTDKITCDFYKKNRKRKLNLDRNIMKRQIKF